MIFCNQLHRRWVAKRTAALLGPQAKQKLIARLFIAIPAGNNAGELVSPQPQQPIILAHRFCGICLVIRADRRI